MAQTLLEGFVSAFGLRSNGSVAVDLVAGCPISLKFGKRDVTIRTAMEQGQYEAIRDALNASLASSGIEKASFNKGFVQFTLSKPDSAIEQYALLRNAIQAYIAPVSAQRPCPVCGGGSCDIAAFHDFSDGPSPINEFVRTHASCHAKTVEQARTRISSGEGNYPLGVLGAILGAVLVLAVSFLIVVLADTVFGVLFIAVAAAAGVGYRLFNGPYGLKGTLTIIAVSILAFAGYIYIECSHYIATYLAISIFDVIPQFEAVAQTAFSLDYLAEDWFQIIFFVVGLVLAAITSPSSVKSALGDIQGYESMVLPLGNQELPRIADR